MIIITGSAGFIGSALLWQFNQMGNCDIICSDKMHNKNKWKNLVGKQFVDWVDREDLFEWLENTNDKISTIIHLGACSSTTEFNMDFLIRNNYEYSKRLFQYAAKRNIKFIYASSAATYGDGSLSYNDDHQLVPTFKPLNPYGYSKHLFDLWVLKQKKRPPLWAGLKFFNVYGPNEYHKNNMASVIYHTFNQTNETGLVKLFKSHREDYKDGEQLRDFIYVKDVTKIIYYLTQKDFKNSGIYNIGTGIARSFYDLAKNVQTFMNKNPNIEFIDMPIEIRNKYQYFTQATMDKLKSIDYNDKFYSLEEGIEDYVKNYLLNNKLHL